MPQSPPSCREVLLECFTTQSAEVYLPQPSKEGKHNNNVQLRHTTGNIYSSPPVKHPLGPLALAVSTSWMLRRLQGENLLLLVLSPEVARANMM